MRNLSLVQPLLVQLPRRLPVLVYVYGGDTYIRYYGFATKRYIVTNLSGLDLKKYTINFGDTDGSHWIENVLAAQLKFREVV